jgi:transposase-like protein
LKLHIDNAHESKRPKCTSCEKDFANRACLKRHLQVVHEKNIEDEEKVNDEDQLRGSGFNKLEYLVSFQALEEKHGPFQRENGLIFCSHCSKSFDRPARLNEHIVAVHEGKKPHNCSYCEQSFGLRRHLKLHIDSAHGHAQRYKCDNCEKDFTQRSSLKRHVEVVHEKDKLRLKCTACDFSSVHQQTINRHFESVHEGKKYSCSHCMLFIHEHRP